MIGNRSAGKIVDEPTEPSVGFHPLQEANDVRLSEVVGKKRADNEVNWLFRLQFKDVGRDPTNCACWFAGLGGDGDSIGIQIDAGELDGNAARASPALDAPEGVAIAAADVDDVKR